MNNNNTGEYSHPIEKIMKSAMEKLKTIIDVNTVIGNPVITSDGATIIPVSKVTVGFVAGGGEYSQINTNNKNFINDYPFAGGSGSGFNIIPVGFLIKENGSYKMIEVDGDGSTSSLIELIGKVFSNMTNDKKDEEVSDNEK